MGLARPTIRVRLTALYAALLVVATSILLLVSYELLARHLRRTLTPAAADDILSRLAAQYALALAGVTLVAVAIGWIASARALAPLMTSAEAHRRFVANASHELRGPLTVIRTETEVTLADPGATLEELRDMGRVVLEATDRTTALLDSLMVLARSRRELLRREPVDLRACAQRAAAAAAEEAAARGIRLRVEGERAEVMGDEALLERLAVNLVENAVRHNEPGGQVEVTTAPAPGGGAVLRVVNGGQLLAGDDVARLTEPFERLDRASGRPGSGLGLSVVRAVAEAHGGRLEIAARPHGGLEVVVTLCAPSDLGRGGAL